MAKTKNSLRQKIRYFFGRIDGVTFLVISLWTETIRENIFVKRPAVISWITIRIV